MAYSDNLMAMDSSWMFHNAFPDTWLLDNFSKETETIAKALQNSFDFQDADDNNIDFSSELVSPWLNNSDSTTVSGGSVEKENNSSMNTKKRRNMVSGGGGGGGGGDEKIKKRRSRASKRAKITFINADADNFRQLVQEVTGVKFGGGVGGGGGVVKPEAHRVVNGLQMIGGGDGGGLPTLDTSSFLVGPTHQNNQLHHVGGGGGGGGGGVAEEVVVADGGSAVSSSKFGFDSCCSFPTLESWKAI